MQLVQVGANDGIRNDLLHQFLRDDARWNAVLIEPVPYLFEKLKGNYAFASDRVACEPVAISQAAGKTMFHYLPSDRANGNGHQLPEWSNGIGSFDRQHLLRHLGPKIDPLIVSIEVPCETLTQLCDRRQLQAVDVLYIDAEGYDWQVLSSFAFDRLHPRVIVYEHRHLKDADRAAAHDLLRRNEYATKELGANTLAVSKRKTA